MTETTESRVVVTWEGQGQPITLQVHGATGAVAVPLTPKRALELAGELSEPAVLAVVEREAG